MRNLFNLSISFFILISRALPVNACPMSSQELLSKLTGGDAASFETKRTKSAFSDLSIADLNQNEKSANLGYDALEMIFESATVKSADRITEGTFSGAYRVQKTELTGVFQPFAGEMKDVERGEEWLLRSMIGEHFGFPSQEIAFSTQVMMDGKIVKGVLLLPHLPKKRTAKEVTRYLKEQRVVNAILDTKNNSVQSYFGPSKPTQEVIFPSSLDVSVETLDFVLSQKIPSWSVSARGFEAKRLRHRLKRLKALIGD